MMDNKVVQEDSGASSDDTASKSGKPSYKLPDFYIIGSAKSGTSSLYSELIKHPDVFMCDPKEPCFFDEEVNWNKGVSWYSSLFDGASDGQICGEASTNYTRWPQVDGVPEKIHAHTPDAKLIYIVRDPLKRAHSHYVHRWTKELHPGKPFTQSFGEFSKVDPMCIDSGKYDEQLQRYLEFFDQSQILVILFEDLIGGSSQVLEKVYGFLGLDIALQRDDEIDKKNVNSDFRESMYREFLVDKYFKSNKVLRSLIDLIPRSIRKFIKRKVLVNFLGSQQERALFEPLPLSASEAGELRLLYKKHNENLARDFNLDLSAWS